MNKKTYKEWKEFKETRRRELELIMRDETLWQKVVRKVTGNSPLRSRVTQSGDAPDKF